MMSIEDARAEYCQLNHEIRSRTCSTMSEAAEYSRIRNRIIKVAAFLAKHDTQNFFENRFLMTRSVSVDPKPPHSGGCDLRMRMRAKLDARKLKNIQ